VVTHQLQVERRTAKAHRPKTDALPLDYATKLATHLSRESAEVRHIVEHVEEILLLNKFFSDCRYMP